MSGTLLGAGLVMLTLATACTTTASSVGTEPSDNEAEPRLSMVESSAAAETTTTPPPTTPPLTTAPPASISRFARPDWLGTRPLPRRPDEHGEVQPTPPALRDRRLETPDGLGSPGGEEFEFTIGPVPAAVLARSSWSSECPVAAGELAYVTVSHWGFVGELHTGELIVNDSVAEDVVGVFREIHAARFPIEQMRVITAEEIDAPPTGDWNDTTSFVCRPAVGSGTWSQHAFGLAIDVNPFHNPYTKADLVLPELASAYLDRDRELPGMIRAGDVVVEAFAAIGWAWGGNWSTLKDWMHFSQSGR